MLCPFFRRHFKVALFFATVVICIGLLWLVLFTPIGASWALNHAEGIIFRTSQASISFGKIQGSIFEGLFLESCWGHLPGQKCSFRIASISMKLLTWATLQRGLTIEYLNCDKIELYGPLVASWTYHLPPPPIECLAIARAFPEIRSMYIKNIYWIPEASAPIKVHLEELSMNGLSKQQGVKKKSALLCLKSGAVLLKGRSLARIKFEGNFYKSPLGIEGTIEGNLLGQHFTTEIQVFSQGQGSTPISGRILHTSFELASFSQWLSPMWQEFLPFAFEGRLSCEGTWAYSTNLGFLANLSGQLKHGRIVAMGFFWPIFETNIDWKFFDSRLTITDLGTTLLGAVTSFGGEILFKQGISPNWNLHLDVPETDLQKILAGIPWMVKTAFQLPAISGIASAACKIIGTGPMFSAVVEGKELKWSDGSSGARFYGHARYCKQCQAEEKPWDLQFSWELPQPPKYLFREMRLGDETLQSKLVGPVNLRACVTGVNLDELFMRACIKSNSGTFGLEGGISTQGGVTMLRYYSSVPPDWEKSIPTENSLVGIISNAPQQDREIAVGRCSLMELVLPHLE